MSSDDKNNKQSKHILKGGDNSFTAKSDDYLDYFCPLEVKVYNNFEKASRNFKALVQKERVLSLYKEKQSHEKPSEKKRRKRNEMRKKLLELEVKNQKILSGEFDKERLRKQAKKEQKIKERESKPREEDFSW